MSTRIAENKEQAQIDDDGDGYHPDMPRSREALEQNRRLEFELAREVHRAVVEIVELYRDQLVNARMLEPNSDDETDGEMNPDS
ncbi:unnamed protein product [Caenorhabditis bovis]|uniref:Uncharacterized protein n=1 Tax=Caenorhabditis bovis TaxID=2654633 RepID=A0A8S1F231_9PELO|nr:unnamed protein product [Caenorhabditis bovis]